MEHATIAPAEGPSDGAVTAPRLGSALRSGGAYAAASAFQRGLVFLLLPVYTRVLDPTAYGRLSILLAIAAAAIIFLSSGLDLAFFRSYFALQSDPVAQQRLLTTAWVFLLVVPPSAAALLALAAAPLLASADLVSPGELALALAGAAAYVSATVVPMALLRAQERLADYLALTAVTAVTTASFTLIAVVGFRAGVAGWLIAAVGANLVTLAAAAKLVPLRLGVGVDWRILREALALGMPLIPHLLSHWGLSVSNRLVLAGMVSTHRVGIYALAANMALPVAILLQGMAQGFLPIYARAATDDAALAKLSRLANVQFVIVLGLTTAATLLAPIAVNYLAPPEYGSAAEIVPWLTAGYGFLGLYFLPMNAVSLVAGRTGKIWMISLVAAGTNLGAMFTLVPWLGLVGAAVAVATGYLVLLVGVGLYSRGPDNPVRYDWARFARGSLAFAGVYILAVATSNDRTFVDALIRLGWMLVAIPLLVLAQVVPRDQVRHAINSIFAGLRLAT